MLLVTGGAGFIGSNFLHFLAENTDYEFINYDALTYAGNLENLKSIEDKKSYNFVKGNILNRELLEYAVDKYKVTGIINFAAESHVDRSIMNSQPFVDANISGTVTLLDVAKSRNIKRMLQVSTDEVYGSLGAEGLFTENSPIQPNSPYSAAKASADHFVQAYNHTFGIDTVITRCSNNYGPYQFPEKLIPLMILNALEDKPLPVYGDGKNVRDWIYVSDHCSGILDVFEKGKSGEVYNIGGNSEMQNIDVVKLILEILGKPESLIEYVKDRPGHDRRYAIDSTKIMNELGWKPEVDFKQGLTETVEWYLNNKSWWQRIRSGAYLDYYKKQYGE